MKHSYYKFRLTKLGDVINSIAAIFFVIGFIARVTATAIWRWQPWLEVFAEVHKQVNIDLDEEIRVWQFKQKQSQREENNQ